MNHSTKSVFKIMMYTTMENRNIQGMFVNSLDLVCVVEELSLRLEIVASTYEKRDIVVDTLHVTAEKLPRTLWLAYTALTHNEITGLSAKRAVYQIVLFFLSSSWRYYVDKQYFNGAIKEYLAHDEPWTRIVDHSML